MCLVAPGTFAMSHSACDRGTKLSSSPYQMETGTLIEAISKPHGFISLRSSSNQPQMLALIECHRRAALNADVARSRARRSSSAARPVCGANGSGWGGPSGIGRILRPRRAARPLRSRPNASGPRARRSPEAGLTQGITGAIPMQRHGWPSACRLAGGRRRARNWAKGEAGPTAFTGALGATRAGGKSSHDRQSGRLRTRGGTRFSPRAGRARRHAARVRYLRSLPAWPGAACRVSGGRRRARIWAIAEVAQCLLDHRSDLSKPERIVLRHEGVPRSTWRPSIAAVASSGRSGCLPPTSSPTIACRPLRSRRRRTGRLLLRAEGRTDSDRGREVAPSVVELR